MRSIFLILLILVSTQLTAFSKEEFSNKLSEVFKKSEAIRSTVRQARLRNDIPASVDGHLRQLMPAYTATEFETQDLDTNPPAKKGFNKLFTFKSDSKSPFSSLKKLFPTFESTEKSKKECSIKKSKDCSKSKKECAKAKEDCISKCKGKDLKECMKKCPSFKKKYEAKAKACHSKAKKCSKKATADCKTKAKSKECKKTKQKCSSEDKSTPKSFFKNLFQKIKVEPIKSDKKATKTESKSSAPKKEKEPNKVLDSLKSFFKVK